MTTHGSSIGHVFVVFIGGGAGLFFPAVEIVATAAALTTGGGGDFDDGGGVGVGGIGLGEDEGCSVSSGANEAFFIATADTGATARICVIGYSSETSSSSSECE